MPSVNGGPSVTSTPNQSAVMGDPSLNTPPVVVDSKGQLVNSAGKRVTDIGRKAIIFGDSRTQQNIDQASVGTNGGYTITQQALWWNYAQALSGQRLDLINNAGVNGDTAAGMLARVNGSTPGVGFGQVGSAAAAAVSPGVLGLNPDVVFFNGGYNDVFGNAATAAATYATAAQIMDAILASGAILVVCSAVAPSSASTGFTAAKCRELILYNNLLRDYTSANRRAYFCDFFAAAISPTSTSVETAAADLRDGTVHENNRAGYREGKALAALITQLFPPRDSLPVSNAATNVLDASIPQLIVNPLFTGTAAITTTGYTGNCAGSQLTNANFVRSGTPTVTLSAVTRADGYGQNNKFVCTFGAANDSFELRMPSVHASAVVGGKYRAQCEVSWTGPAGAALTASDNLRSVQLYIQYNDGTTNYFAYDTHVQATDGALSESATMTLRTPEFTIPPGGTPTTFRPNVTITGNGSGSPEVQIGRLSLVRTG